eukprot:scaffold54858_cov51-Phaeocystis_antarctica.AAC.1
MHLGPVVGHRRAPTRRRKLRAELRVGDLPAAEGEVLARLDHRALRGRREDVQAAVAAVAQPQLLGGDGDAAVGRVHEEDAAAARADDDAAVVAVRDLHLRRHVQQVDGAVLARRDAHGDRGRRPLGLARARRLEEGLPLERHALDVPARPRRRAAPRERLGLLLARAGHHRRWRRHCR